MECAMTSSPDVAAARSPAAPAVDLLPLEPVIAQHQGQRGALIPILQATQAVYGYLPREALALIASRLGLSLGKVYGVATFYSQFYLTRRGRHLLRLCDGTACHVKGTPTLLTAVGDAFDLHPGDTSPDGQLSLEIVYCLGSCALAPVAVLDGQVMGRLRQDALLRQVRRKISDA
jgi:NADH-quinone oxidoreductase subunit E